MIDLNRKQDAGSRMQNSEEVSPAVVIGAVIVIGLWMVWAFVIGGLL